MTVPDVCKTLGISRATLYNWIAAGTIKPIPPKTTGLKKQGRVYFRESDVRKLMPPQA